MEERGWSAAAWARQAGVTPTNLTRFLKDPERGSLPSAETIGRLSLAAGREPRFLDDPPVSAGSVPVLLPSQVQKLMDLPEHDAVIYLRDLIRSGARTLAADPSLSARAFALRITSPHMNAAGLLPEDHAVIEPADRKAPRDGDLVVTVDGEQACGYRYHAPLLVPVSTDPACCPLRIGDVPIAGVAVRVVRSLRA